MTLHINPPKHRGLHYGRWLTTVLHEPDYVWVDLKTKEPLGCPLTHRERIVTYLAHIMSGWARDVLVEREGIEEIIRAEGLLAMSPAQLEAWARPRIDGTVKL